MHSPQPGDTPQTFESGWRGHMATTPEPDSPRSESSRHSSAPRRGPMIYHLSEKYQPLVESPSQFKPVLRERLARLQNTLPQLSAESLRQARADIVFLKSVLDDEGLTIAQVRAGAVFSARV